MIEERITFREFEEKFDINAMYQIISGLSAHIEEIKEANTICGYQAYELIVNLPQGYEVHGEPLKTGIKYRIELNPVLCAMLDMQHRYGASSIKEKFRQLIAGD